MNIKRHPTEFEEKVTRQVVNRGHSDQRSRIIAMTSGAFVGHISWSQVRTEEETIGIMQLQNPSFPALKRKESENGSIKPVTWHKLTSSITSKSFIIKTDDLHILETSVPIPLKGVCVSQTFVYYSGCVQSVQVRKNQVFSNPFHSYLMETKEK